MPTMICTRRAYLTDDRQTVVERGPGATALLCGEGRMIPADRVIDLANHEEFFRPATKDDLRPRPVQVLQPAPASLVNITSSGAAIADKDLVKIKRQKDDGSELEPARKKLTPKQKREAARKKKEQANG